MTGGLRTPALDPGPGEFQGGAPFAAAGGPLASELDRVPISLVCASPDRHDHVPLRIAPCGHTTYRGS